MVFSAFCCGFFFFLEILDSISCSTWDRTPWYYLQPFTTWKRCMLKLVSTDILNFGEITLLGQWTYSLCARYCDTAQAAALKPVRAECWRHEHSSLGCEAAVASYQLSYQERALAVVYWCLKKINKVTSNYLKKIHNTKVHFLNQPCIWSEYRLPAWKPKWRTRCIVTLIAGVLPDPVHLKCLEIAIGAQIRLPQEILILSCLNLLKRI